MNRMSLVVAAASSLLVHVSTPVSAESTPFYDPSNAASSTGYTIGYKLYRTIGCPNRELLGKPCPMPAPAPTASRAMEAAPVMAPGPAELPTAAPIATPPPATGIAMPTRAIVLAKNHALVLDDVNFKFDSDKLLPRAESILNQVVEDLRAAGYPLTLIDGYTDSTGPDAYNIKLSQRRAESVKIFLIDKGVPIDSLMTAAFGESLCVASNSTMEGRYRNRRVELNIAE